MLNETEKPYILHLASGDLWAGAEAQILTLATCLHRRFDVRVLAVLLNHGPLEAKLRQAGIHVIVLDESKMNPARILYRLLRILREYRPDVIHTHRLKENILGSIAGRLAGNIPSMRTAHGAIENLPPWRQAHRKLFYYIDHLCGCYLQKKIVSVSDELAGKLRETFNSGKILTIENGVDLDAIGALQTNRQKTNKSGLKIGIAGRLVRVKRIDIFIETAYYLNTNHPGSTTEFYIYGDGPLRDEMEKLCQLHGVEQIVHFEGHVDNLSAKLTDLDMLLMTSDHEGLPMVLLEAMAAGTPVIAHAVGGIPKLLDYGACGVLVNSQTASEYTSAIMRLSESPEGASTLASKALNRARNLYSSQASAKEYLEVYSTLADRNV